MSDAYDTTYIISYMDSDVFQETDEVNNEEKMFIRNCIYRQDLLNIFKIDEFNEKAINKRITKLYKLLKYHSGLYNCMLAASKSTGEEDGLIGLMVLFSFDYLIFSHPCICEYIESGFINPDNLKQLTTELDKIIST
jgi:hypothetical protein